MLVPLMHADIRSAATPEQVAATITWLIGDDASNATGALMPCDGGWSAI